MAGAEYETGQIDGAQVAGFIRKKRLLPARIGGFDLALRGSGIVAVDAIQEDNAGVAAGPRLVCQQVKNFAGVEAALGLPGDGIDQRVILTGVRRLHEGFGQPHGKIEIVEFPFFFLGLDEIQNVRMINAQNAHVRAAPRAALLDLLCGGVEDAQEGNRAGGHTARSAHAGIPGAQTGEGKARAAAGFVDHGGEFHGIENFFNGIAHRQYKTGGELPQVAPGVHQRRRIGQKQPLTEQRIKFVGQFVGLPGGLFVFHFFLSNTRADAPEQPRRIFFGLAFGVFAVVTLGKHKFGVGGQKWSGQIGRHIHHHDSLPGVKASCGCVPFTTVGCGEKKPRR